MAASLCKLSVTSSSPFVKNDKFTLSSRFSQTGLCHFPTWNGLKHMNMSLSPMPLNTRRRDRCKGKIVYASLFGVGAPEALVIGAVALLVFGPEGLAEVARNLGKTLRAFQPTIKELQEVSREFKNTLDREIGLDDSLRSTNGVPSNNAYSSDPLKIIEEHLKVATSPPQDLSSSQPEGLVEIESQSQDNSPPYDATLSEDQTEITEEQLETSAFTQHDVTSLTPPPASPNEDDNQPQVAIQETAIAAPPTELPELR